MDAERKEKDWFDEDCMKADERRNVSRKKRLRNRNDGIKRPNSKP